MTDKHDVRKVGEQDEDASLFSLEELDLEPSSPSLAGEASEPRGAFDSLMQIGECGGIAAISESVRPPPPPPPPPPKAPPPRDKPSWLGAESEPWSALTDPLAPPAEASARNQPSLSPVALPGPESVHPEPPAATRWPRRNGDRAAIVAAVAMLLVAVAFIAQPAEDSHSAQAANPAGEATAFGAHVTAMTQAIVEVEEAAPKPEPVVASVEDASDEEPPMDGTGERGAAPSGAEADADSGGDKKPSGAEDSKASKSASGADGEFNRDAARSAMFAAASRASGCRSKKAKGRSRANVTIAPSGSVSNVSISGPAAGTKAGRCAAAAFRSVRVPPFSGSSVTLGKSFRIRK